MPRMTDDNPNTRFVALAVMISVIWFIVVFSSVAIWGERFFGPPESWETQERRKTIRANTEPAAGW